ncbi:MAG: linear amide C-N hydrolase [Ruminiclostridium sp.]|nr:linear amide C-N hydrolase [Ruminiclostridium sp.]
MCTSIALTGNKAFFGRNMDIDYSFGECAVNTPRSFPLAFRTGITLEKHYAFAGTAVVTDNFPLYAEAMNENGLYIAALKFPENAFYNETEIKGKINLAPYEIIPFILAKCRNLNEVRALLSEIEIIALPFSDNMPLSPLHWHIADKNGSLVLEKTADGMHIYENPANVLTNNPPFPFHLHNITHYQNLSSENPDISEKRMLGLGTVGLVGDFTPASRFVRADYLLKNTPEDCIDANHFFHILDNVAIPRGAVRTPDGKYHYTSYSCCFDAEKLILYYRIYDCFHVEEMPLTTEGNNLIVKEYKK